VARCGLDGTQSFNKPTQTHSPWGEPLPGNLVGMTVLYDESHFTIFHLYFTFIGQLDLVCGITHALVLKEGEVFCEQFTSSYYDS
jgi:hypothetical protein